MKIKKLTIENFRGIGSAVIDFENFTTLVGPNNIGKSTILNAIHMVLDNKKPKLEDWPSQKPSDSEMHITCEFNNLEDWEKSKPAISKLLHDDMLKIKLLAKWNDEKSDYTHDYYVFHSKTTYPWTEEGYSNYKKHPTWKEISEAFGIRTKAHFDDKSDDIEAYISQNHPEYCNTSTDWHLKKFANSLQQAVPHVMYVPASFKIEDELKSTNSSPFSFLFSNKLFPRVKSDESYTNYIDKAELLQKKLKGKSEDGSKIEGLDDVLNSVSVTLNKILDFDSKVKLSIGNIDIEPLFMKAATFLIDDEIETSLQYQGSGVQRALAFAMLESNAAIECEVSGEQRTIIVLYEEPELYIHPHLMKRLKSTLKDRSESNKWQVICTTHSPFLIDIADTPESLKLIKRDPSNARQVHQVRKEIFERDGEYDERVILRAALDFHPTVCEALFAKRVIVVEGDTEVAVFGMIEGLCDKLGVEDSLHDDTTIVSAGGKWTIPALVKILNELDIDYRVIHDKDIKDRDQDTLDSTPAIDPYRANAKILASAKDNTVFSVDDTFEHVLWGTDERGEIKSSNKPFNSWKRTKDYISGEIDLSAESQDTLRKIIKFAYCR